MLAAAPEGVAPAGSAGAGATCATAGVVADDVEPVAVVAAPPTEASAREPAMVAAAAMARR